MLSAPVVRLEMTFAASVIPVPQFPLPEEKQLARA